MLSLRDVHVHIGKLHILQGVNFEVKAGEATAFEVVDAQTTLNQARNDVDDGLARYRVALANLQTLTGN